MNTLVTATCPICGTHCLVPERSGVPLHRHPDQMSLDEILWCAGSGVMV